MRKLFRSPPTRQEPSTRVHEVDVEAFRDLVLGFVKEVESTS